MKHRNQLLIVVITTVLTLTIVITMLLLLKEYAVVGLLFRSKTLPPALTHDEWGAPPYFLCVFFLFFTSCSDHTVCDRGCHRDDADIPEDEAAHRHCIAEGGQQVRLHESWRLFFVYLLEHQIT